MQINWKVRLKNKVILMTFIPFVLSFIYQMLSCFEIVPKVSEYEALEMITQLINVLALLGIVVDCTTDGICDSEQALTYTEPKMISRNLD